MRFDAIKLDGAVAQARRAIDMRGAKTVRYGVGGSCSPIRTSIDRHCYRGMQPICDMQRVGARVQQTGGSAFTLTVLPNKVPFFEPKAVRATVVDANDPDLDRRVFFTAVTINDFPQEAVNETSPTPATTAGWWSDDWDNDFLYAVPVPWGFFSNQANEMVLKIHGFVRGYAAGITVDIAVTVYGNAMQCLPDGCECGKPVIGTYKAVANGGNGRGSAVP